LSISPLASVMKQFISSLRLQIYSCFLSLQTYFQVFLVLIFKRL